MSSLLKLNSNLFKTRSYFKLLYAPVHTNDVTDEVQKVENDKDKPVQMENPFVKKKPKCLLCKYDIEPDFKNGRLLSQFVSRFTGRVYGRHITGLCLYKQQRVEEELAKSRKAGFIPYVAKSPNFLEDPDLYDPDRPVRPHPY